jgi:hypothetical protein
MWAASEASKKTQTTPIPITTGEISPMEELRMGFGPVQISWKYLHDLKGKILELETQQDRSRYYIKQYVDESIAYREKYEGALHDLEKQKCDTAHAEERIRVLGMKFQKMEDAYIEERNSHCRTREYTNRLLQENDTLKKRIDYLEARQSETHTQLGGYVEEARSPMTASSVPLSPREEYQQYGNPNTPRMVSDVDEDQQDEQDPHDPHDQQDEHGEESMSPTLFNYIEEMRRLEYGGRGGGGCGVSVSSRTTDCSGDPMCHSDSD